MQRQRSVLNPLPAHEFAARVIDRLVRHHIRMIVRDRHSVRIEIEWTWTKRAHHKPVALECLMDWRRKMKPPHARLEILDVDRPRVIVAVPTHYIERMMIEDRFRDRVAF